MKGDAFIRLSLLPKDTATVCLNLLLSSRNKINKRKKPKSFKLSKWECFLFAPLSSLGHITDDIFLHSCIRWAYKDRRGILKPASVAYGCIDKREIGLDKLGQCIKKRDIALPTKVPIVNALVFPVIRCGCESWTIRKAELLLPGLLSTEHHD